MLVCESVHVGASVLLKLNGVFLNDGIRYSASKFMCFQLQFESEELKPVYGTNSKIPNRGIGENSCLVSVFLSVCGTSIRRLSCEYTFFSDP